MVSKDHVWGSHLAIVKSITFGACNSQGTCLVSLETPAYNLNNILSSGQALTDSINPVKKIQNFIEKNSGWTCAANLLLMGFKFITFWVSVAFTMIQEGAAGVLVVLYIFGCSSKINSERVLQKGQRKQKVEDYPL